jgi:glycosyltransferase involved in cell wall biosynthesis
MKILYHHRIRSKDGQYVHVEEMTAAFARLGHEIVLVGPAAIETEEFGSDAGAVGRLKRALPGFVYEVLEFAYALPATVRLWLAVRAHRPDGIYERYNLFFPAGVWVRRLTGIPLLLEVNAPLAQERARHDKLALKKLASWSEGYSWRKADFVLTVTEVLAGYVRRKGVADSRIVVIPNGVNRERFGERFDRNEAKRKLGLEGKLVLGFTGFVREWHGLEQVIDWIAEQPDHSALHLLVVGDGPARKALEERVRKHGLGQQVTLTGIVSREQVGEYVAAFDVALQPAVVEYASPLKLFEYLALGCAIIAPCAANIREILVDGENAILFDPANPRGLSQTIARVCGDEALRQRIGRQASQTIGDRRLTWDHNAERVIELFQRLGVRTHTKQESA